MSSLSLVDVWWCVSFGRLEATFTFMSVTRIPHDHRIIVLSITLEMVSYFPLLKMVKIVIIQEENEIEENFAFVSSKKF
jgi:hypothetical protein